VLPTATPPAATPTRAQLARNALAAHLKIPAESLRLESEREEQWRDGALGCPAPGQSYTQAIVPGYLLVFSDGMAAHSVHTTAAGFPLVYCSELGPVILNREP
jgi:hypothetical protein